VCLQTSAGLRCLKDFDFVASVDPLLLPVDIDGVLGIGPYSKPSDSSVIGSPLLRTLEDQGLIGYEAASVFLGFENKQQIRLGRMNEEMISPSD